MSDMKTSGLCAACGRRFSKMAIARHLGSCPRRSAGTSPSFVLGVYAGPYWLYLEAPAEATLEDLDVVLRKTWLECCGHMSMFEIEKGCYLSHTDAIEGDGEYSMDIALGRVLRPGLKFSYEYDFGSTTELRLKVLAERQNDAGRVTLLARNDPPQIVCGQCKKPEAIAKTVCRECGTKICDSCGNEHECARDLRLPLVNSPRAGVCGYSG